MKILFALLLLVTCRAVAQNYSDSVLKIREAHDTEFRNGILNAEELQQYDGICYFPIDTAYRIEALLIRSKGKKFAMPMTKRRDQEVYYRQRGIVRFTLHDTVCELRVYENLDLKHDKAYRNYLFLPFRDGTTGTTSYGGGRFLDLRKTGGDSILIDFNLAYHPYCLYSKRYSCPIPPAENTLAVTITAGECYRVSAH